jgi:hypothetical protein
MASGQEKPNESGQNPDISQTMAHEPIGNAFLKELKKMRTGGLRKAVAKGQTKTFTTLVETMLQEPADNAPRVVAEIASIIKEVLTKLDASHSDALEILLELEPTAGSYLGVSQRRIAAAQRLNVSGSTFERYFERTLLTELAEGLADRYGLKVSKAHEYAKTVLALVANDAARFLVLCVMLRNILADAPVSETRAAYLLPRTGSEFVESVMGAFQALLFSTAYCLGNRTLSPATQQVARYLPIKSRLVIERAITDILSYVELDLGYQQRIMGLDPSDYHKQLATLCHTLWPPPTSVPLESLDAELKKIISACVALLNQLSPYTVSPDYNAAIEYGLTAVANYCGERTTLRVTGRSATLEDILTLATG